MGIKPDLIWTKDFFTPDGKRKQLRILCGDICAAEPCDVVVCSAFKGDYIPTAGTLIRGLWEGCGISVWELSERPEIDLRQMGCWLSEETPGKFRRVACVELIDWLNRRTAEYRDGVMLKGAFSTLKYILERADINGIPVRSVILPVLGAGSQGVEMCYIAGPLLHHCIGALNSIEGLESLTFCEYDRERAMELARCLEQMLTTPGPAPSEVFISYSSAQTETAYNMRDSLRGQGLRCWMAPDSIPPGSSYQIEIPVALGNTPVVTLLLTPEAERSRWVQKEIGTAVGSGHIIVPYQPYDYPIGSQFRFLLEGEQILRGWKYGAEEGLRVLTSHVRERLRAMQDALPMGDSLA